MTEPSIPGYGTLTQIGKGGFSRVYRAEQTKFGRDVAVKVLNFGVADADDRRAFERETLLMGRVSTHPHIVTVFDTAFTEQGQPCIVMELCSGGSLASRIEDAVYGLSVDEGLAVGVAIASALDASHKVGVVHCDLKPQNIMISEFGQPSLGDFGISVFDDERTRTGAMSGVTLHYAAPEIIEGGSPDAASDIYSLGATLYTAFAGERPFGSTSGKQSAGQLARRVLLEEPPPLTNFGVPELVDQAIAKAMHKDPEQRFGSAGEFAEALSAVGRQLGVTTAAPQVGLTEDLRPAEADNVPAGDPMWSAAAAASPAPLREFSHLETDTTIARVQKSVADSGPSSTPQHPVNTAPEPITEDGITRQRMALSAVAGLAAIGLAIGLVMVLTNGDEPEPAASQTAVVANARPAADPLVAPSTPSDVQLERLGDNRVEVAWVGQPAGDDRVEYEVRVQGADADPITTDANEYVLDNIADSDRPCVTVVAVRGNRVSAPTDVVCVAAKGGPAVEVRPESCVQGSCEVRIALSDFPAEARLTIAVHDPAGVDINGFGDTYEASVTTDDRGQIDGWRLRVPPLLDAGTYFVTVADDVNESFSDRFEVTAP